jgi:hypothetical protein
MIHTLERTNTRVSNREVIKCCPPDPPNEPALVPQPEPGKKDKSTKPEKNPNSPKSPIENPSEPPNSDDSVLILRSR